MFGNGPFLLGDKASYADITVAAWLRMASRTMPAEGFKTWNTIHGGAFGRLHDAMEKYTTVYI